MRTQRSIVPGAPGKNRVSTRTGKRARGPAGDAVNAWLKSVENGTVGIGVMGLRNAIGLFHKSHPAAAASFTIELVLLHESQHAPAIAWLCTPCERRFEPRCPLPDPLA